jgi:hypothetical protein
MLQTVFSGASFQINWDALCVELGSSKDLLKTKDGEYRALTGSLDVWYDQATATSYLLLALIPSPEMSERHEELGDAWGRTYVPFINLYPDPLLRRERRAFLNSISTRFVDYPLMLTFHNETLVTDNSVVPSHQEFYEAQERIPPQLFVQNTATE